MPTKRLNINLTDAETIEVFVAVTIIFQSINKENYNYTDVLKILSRYALEHPRVVLGKV